MTFTSKRRRTVEEPGNIASSARGEPLSGAGRAGYCQRGDAAVELPIQNQLRKPAVMIHF